MKPNADLSRDLPNGKFCEYIFFFLNTTYSATTQKRTAHQIASDYRIAYRQMPATYACLQSLYLCTYTHVSIDLLCVFSNRHKKRGVICLPPMCVCQWYRSSRTDGKITMRLFYDSKSIQQFEENQLFSRIM